MYEFPAIAQGNLAKRNVRVSKENAVDRSRRVCCVIQQDVGCSSEMRNKFPFAPSVFGGDALAADAPLRRTEVSRRLTKYARFSWPSRARDNSRGTRAWTRSFLREQFERIIFDASSRIYVKVKRIRTCLKTESRKNVIYLNCNFEPGPDNYVETARVGGRGEKEKKRKKRTIHFESRLIEVQSDRDCNWRLITCLACRKLPTRALQVVNRW